MARLQVEQWIGFGPTAHNGRDDGPIGMWGGWLASHPARRCYSLWGMGLAYSRVSREPNAVAQPDDVNGACDYCSCEDINIISTSPFIIFIFKAREGASHTHIYTSPLSLARVVSAVRKVNKFAVYA